jgi:RNA polymerase sigma-70 factor (ECF subfamily)
MADADDFLKLFLAHQREIRVLVSAAVRDPHARDDLVQQTALILWRTFEKYDRTRPFVAWARGVARNVILQHYRQSARCPVLLDPAALEAVLEAYNETPEDEAELYQAALRECLQKAPPKSRQLLELRYQQTLGLAEMAAGLHCTVNAVNQTLVRIRTALRACIESQLRTPSQQGSC